MAAQYTPGPKPGVLYRLRSDHEGWAMTSAELMDSVQTFECTSKPTPIEEWYCCNEDCTVREVEIRCVVLPGERKPRKFKCPACGKVMELHNYIQTHTLVPAK